MSRRWLPLILLLAVIPLAGCGGGLKSGTVTEKRIIPAHDDTIILPIYAGQNCYGSGTSRFCTPRYIYIPWQVHYGTAYELKLEACKDDFSNNTRKCKHGEAFVDQDTYASMKIGDDYERTKGDGKQQFKKLHSVRKSGGN